MKYIYLLFACFFLACCTDKSPLKPPSSVPKGAYAYTGYDTSGTEIVNGWFTMVFSDSIHCVGEWHFKRVSGNQDIGPQIGEGELVGGIENGNVWINLNPTWADNNVFLNGRIAGDVYEGTWMWVTIAGPWIGGSFKALRQ